MDSEIKIVKCPKCGSMNLEGVYEEKKGQWKYAIFGLLFWFIAALRNKPTAYWRCIECGETFPMD